MSIDFSGSFWWWVCAVLLAGSLFFGVLAILHRGMRPVSNVELGTVTLGEDKVDLVSHKILRDVALARIPPSSK